MIFQNHILILWRGRVSVIPKDQIIAIKANGNFSQFYLLNEKIVNCNFSLKKIQARLQSEGFIRIHKSWIINVCLLKEFNSRSKEISLSNFQNPLPFSRMRRTEFLRQLQASWGHIK